MATVVSPRNHLTSTPVIVTHVFARLKFAIGAVLLATPIATMAGGAEPAMSPSRVAIIAATAQRSLAELLTAELSRQRDLALVEREAIDDVVKELSLAAGQTGDGEESLKLGGLLAADAILFVEPEAQSEPPQVRLKLVETRTGIRLGDWPVPAAGMGAADVAEVLAGLRQAAPKLGVPLGDRHLLGMIGIQPEVATAELAKLARALTAIVERDLTDLPNVVVLDRDKIRRLTAERNLTGVEVDLKASSKLVEGGIRRDGERLTVTLKLVPLSGGAANTASATVTAAGDMATIRRQVVTAVTDLLGTASRSLPMADPAEESKLLAARARRLTDFRDHAEAIRLAEAAYVLAPGPDTFGVLHHAYVFSEQDIASGGSMMKDRPDFSRPWFDRERYPTVEAARVGRLETLIRLAEAGLDYYEHCARHPELEREFPIWDHRLLFTYRIPTETDEERRLVAEHARIQRAMYDRILEVRRAAGGPGAADLVLYKLAKVDWLLSDGGKISGQTLVEFLREIQEALALEQAAGRWPADRRGAPAIYHDLLREALNEHAGGRVPVADVRPYLEELAATDDASLRIVGWSRLLELPGNEGAEAAERLLDTLLFGDVPRHRPNVSPPLGNTLLFKGLGNKAGKRLAAAGSLTAYLEKIVSQAEAAGDVSPLFAAPLHLVALIRCDQPRDDEFFRRIAALVAAKAYPPDKAAMIASFNGVIAEDRRHREASRASETRTGPFSPAKTGKLDGYEVRDLQITNPEPGFGHLAMFHVDRTPEGDPQRPLVVVWSKHPARIVSWRKEDPPEFDYLIGRVSTDGGVMKVEGRCRLPLKSIRFMASAGERHFFATEQHGVAVVTDGGRTIIGEADGVPGGWIGSMAWLDGRLYLGIESNFVALDPENKRCELIAAGRSLTARNPLDGAGTFSTTALAADPPRKRLVILATSNETHERSPTGLWSFTPDGNAWHRLVAGHCFEFTLGEDAVFYGRHRDESLYRLDLATSRITPLLGYAKSFVPHADQRGQPGWMIFDDLLFLPNNSRVAAFDASGVGHSWSGGLQIRGTIHRVGEELVIFDEYGDRIRVIRRKKPSNGQERAP
jgi:hypothetical protein